MIHFDLRNLVVKLLLKCEVAIKLAHDLVVGWSSELLSQVASQNPLTQLEHINVSVQKMHKTWRMNGVILTEFLTSFMQLEKDLMDFFFAQGVQPV